MTKPVEAQILRLVRELGVDDPLELHKIRTLVFEARLPAWWECDTYTDAITPAYAVYLSQEEDSEEMRTWEPSLIPGLLQTRRYLEALMDRHQPPLNPPQRAARLALRFERQRRFLCGDQRLSLLWAILDETAIRRLVGGRQTMHEQIRHLITCSELPNVNLQITPFNSGATATAEPFVIFSSRNPLDSETVSIELTREPLWYEDRDSVTYYQNLFTSVMRDSLDTESSRSFLQEWADKLKG